MMVLASALLLSAMTSADAVITLLNSPTASSKARFAQAVEVAARDAEEGKPLQQFVLGVTVADPKTAKRYLDASRPQIRAMAERRGNPLAWYLLSVETNDYEMLRRAAKGGNVQAMNALGTMALQEALSSKTIAPIVREKVLKISYDYFCKAAAQRDPNGFINLGTCYLQGFGCARDLTMAFESFKSAAEMGHPEGMDNLSACYELGHGVKKDLQLSLFWRMKARALRGDAAAEKWLKDQK